MADLLDSLDEDLRAWLEAQPLFFVATAPLDGDGHVNCSPRGGDCFRVVSDDEVYFVDLTGSGTETAAHLGENGRICLMWCAFDGPPRIVRIHGRGEVLRGDHPDFAACVERVPQRQGVRCVVRVRVTRRARSCGFGVPLMSYQGQRDTLDRWAAKKGEDGLDAYRAATNARSIDGLPGLVAEGA